MLSKIGPTELIIILFIALLVFGPNALPKLGKTIGKTLSGFKQGLQEELDTPQSAIKQTSEVADNPSGIQTASPTTKAE